MKASAGKRVLMLLENSTYPADPRVSQEARTLVEAGYQVSVICQRALHQRWHENLGGVLVFRYPAPPQAQSFLGYAFEYAYSFVATVVLSFFVWARPGFDIIHSANPPDTAVFMALFYKLFGKRFVFDHHDLAPEIYRIRSKNRGNRLVHQVLIWLERTSFRFADHVISTNESYKSLAIQRGHVPKERVTVVRNGPALDRLKLIEPDPGLKRRGVVIIGYIGAIALQDGVDYLLRALQLLKTRLKRKDFFCIVVGDGCAVAELKAQASVLGLDEHIFFTGFISDTDTLNRYLSSIDIGTDPAPSNELNDRSTMIKLMEYMALRKPIVAFDLPEHRVSTGEAALFARPNDELDFARQISVLMDDPERRAKMGHIGRERVEKELAWPFQAKKLLDAYESIGATRPSLRTTLG